MLITLQKNKKLYLYKKANKKELKEYQCCCLWIKRPHTESNGESDQQCGLHVDEVILYLKQVQRPAINIHRYKESIC